MVEFRLSIGVSWIVIEIEGDNRIAVACKAVVPLEYVEAARVMLLRVVVYVMAVILIVSLL